MWLRRGTQILCSFNVLKPCRQSTINAARQDQPTKLNKTDEYHGQKLIKTKTLEVLRKPPIP